MTSDQLQRVQALAETLRQQGITADDYLANGVLFAEFELTQEQRGALRAIAARCTLRRAFETGQQSLFGE